MSPDKDKSETADLARAREADPEVRPVAACADRRDVVVARRHEPRCREIRRLEDRHATGTGGVHDQDALAVEDGLDGAAEPVETVARDGLEHGPVRGPDDHE